MSKKCIIYETISDVRKMSVERDNDGLMKLTGIFGVCGVKNNNQRVYEVNNYKAMIKKLQDKINTEGCPGELEHPNSMNITLENISHKIDSIVIDNEGIVTGTITLLNTPKGKIAQEIVNGGLPLYISSRAQGNVDNNGLVTLEDLKTYDLVGTPGFSQAKLKLNENQILESINDNIYYISNKTNNEDTENYNNITEKYIEEDIEKYDVIEYALDDILKLKTKKKENKNIKENLKNNFNNNMNEKLLLEKINNLEEKIKYIKMSQDYIQENFDNIPNTNILANGIQNWIQKYFVTKEDLNEALEDTLEDTLEDYNDRVLENTKEWIIEQYSPEVQKWITEQYSPEVQKWIIEQYSPVLEQWISENKKPTLENIDETLNLLESISTPKPKLYNNITNESSNSTEPRYIREMPADKKVLWKLASKELKESIERRAKLYNFINEASIENFWENIKFENPSQINNINESVDKNTYSSDWESRIRMSLHKN